MTKTTIYSKRIQYMLVLLLQNESSHPIGERLYCSHYGLLFHEPQWFDRPKIHWFGKWFPHMGSCHLYSSTSVLRTAYNMLVSHLRLSNRFLLMVLLFWMWYAAEWFRITWKARSVALLKKWSKFVMEFLTKEVTWHQAISRFERSQIA